MLLLAVNVSTNIALPLLIALYENVKESEKVIIH